jgi:cytochrome b6-f complex iron-sulfur subunit/menaquinol-cytochrome c reductase iron-sulfur subunit
MTTARRDGSSGEPEPDPTPRRGALTTLVTLGSLAYAGAIAAPAAGFLAPAGGDGGGHARWIRVGRLADLPAAEPRRLAVTGERRDAFTRALGELLGAVWLVREGDAVRAWSAACPHLGCSIDLAPGGGFACPCHTSRFGAAGEVVSGPSPRAMDPLAARVVDGFVEVDFRRFREGGAERVEARG